MEELTEFGQELQENTVYVNPEKSTMDDCTSIRFTGKNSILFIEDGVNIRDSEIVLEGIMRLYISAEISTFTD